MWLVGNSARDGISIHAPHEGERLLCPIAYGARAHYFNPRSPRGGATIYRGCMIIMACISIHAPHEGERRYARIASNVPHVRFQSTLPTRGSDTKERERKISWYISIHAPHEGERLSTDIIHHILFHFNPRSPRGGATT